MKSRLQQRSERGVVSLITSILVSILFVIVVVSMVNILTREQNQAGNADEATRAFYAAESGVEDGIQTIKTALQQSDPLGALTAAENGGKCITQTNPTVNAKYTCLVLSRSSNSLDGTLKTDSVGDQIDLSHTDDVATVVINWNEPTSAGGSDPTIPTNSSGALTGLDSLASKFTTGAAWGNNPAVIEATFVTFPKSVSDGTATFNATDPNQLGIIENLIAPAVKDGTHPFAGTIANYAAAPATNSPSLGNCIPTSQGAPAGTNYDPRYNCHVAIAISDSATNNHILRLRSRFNNANFSVQVYNTHNVQVDVPDQYESIDVTATAGSTERRIHAKVAIIKNSAALDYALFSDDDICKDFLLRDSRNGAGGAGDNSANAGSCPF